MLWRQGVAVVERCNNKQLLNWGHHQSHTTSTSAAFTGMGAAYVMHVSTDLTGVVATALWLRLIRTKQVGTDACQI